MSEDLDLTGAKWVAENEIFFISIKESLEDNFPNIDIEKDLEEQKMTMEDLLNQEKLKFFLKKMEEKYPEA